MSASEPVTVKVIREGRGVAWLPLLISTLFGAQPANSERVAIFVVVFDSRHRPTARIKVKSLAAAKRLRSRILDTAGSLDAEAVELWHRESRWTELGT